VLIHQPRFARKVASLIRGERSNALVHALDREAAWGAIALARRLRCSAPSQKNKPVEGSSIYLPAFAAGKSPTERRNPKSMRFHELAPAEMVELMLGEEKSVVPALLREKGSIVTLVELAARTLRKGGRIFYAGAGTSGRLGVLDASECPPTFRSTPDMIQGIIAGGQRALWQAVEGAEDDAESGARGMQGRGVTSRDLVIGIAASGRTPFVWGAFAAARKVRAKTALICFNPTLQIDNTKRPQITICPDLGPEVLTGSTRLKAGTATKLILNLVSTISMVRLGKVLSNLMVDLNPSNVKLRDRAIRIVQDLAGCAAEAAESALKRHNWNVKAAWSDLRETRTPGNPAGQRQ
jgi:N-acetylmuramic acid 6-phosphate etherase